MSCQHEWTETPHAGYVVCDQCGTFKSTVPQVDYASNYWSGERGSLYEQAYNIDLDIPEGATCSKAKFILDRIACDRGAALEIGCAPGRMLYWLKWAARFKEVTGMEASEACEQDVTVISCDTADYITCGMFPSTKEYMRASYFHYILACDVFEHSTEPIAFLAECARLLKPGGQLFLVLPLADELPADSRFFKADEHAYLHSRKNMMAMMHDAGFFQRTLDKWSIGHDTVSGIKI